MKRFGELRTGVVRDDRGQALISVAVMLAMLFGVTAIAVDVGWALQIRRELQASTDAAALAAAVELPDVDRAIATANAYSAIAGGLFIPPFLFAPWLDRLSMFLPSRQTRELVVWAVQGGELPWWSWVGVTYTFGNSLLARQDQRWK